LGGFELLGRFAATVSTVGMILSVSTGFLRVMYQINRVTVDTGPI